MKLGFAAAGSAFLLSFLVGLVSGAGLLAVVFRAVLFAALFFGLSFGGSFLVSRFLPELLGSSEEANSESEAELGSSVDVVVGDEETGSEAEDQTGVRIRQRASAEDEVAEEIEAFLPSNDFSAERADAQKQAGLDLGGEGRYTETHNAGAFGSSKGKVAEPALPPGLMDDVDVLPDLDSMSDSFVAPLIEDATERSSDDSTPRSFSAPRSSEAGGDFDPREMAAAIQTILKRDQKG